MKRYGHRTRTGLDRALHQTFKRYSGETDGQWFVQVRQRPRQYKLYGINLNVAKPILRSKRTTAIEA